MVKLKRRQGGIGLPQRANSKADHHGWGEAVCLCFMLMLVKEELKVLYMICDCVMESEE